jgi:ATP-dependent exoDNAse (exonuclease V) alpha subunit
MNTATPFSATVTLSHGLSVRLEAETSGTFAGQLTLAYATTVHKAQGSEFSHVVLPVTNHGAWDRTLLYTACTRAKDRLYILGTSHALEAIVQSVRAPKPSSFCEALRRNACGSR